MGVLICCFAYLCLYYPLVTSKLSISLKMMKFNYSFQPYVTTFYISVDVHLHIHISMYVCNIHIYYFLCPFSCCH